MSYDFNIKIGKNYVVESNEDILPYIKRKLIEMDADLIEDYKDIMYKDDFQSDRNTVILILNIDKLNLIQIGNVMKLRNKKITNLTIIGVKKEGRLKHFSMEGFEEIELSE